MDPRLPSNLVITQNNFPQQGTVDWVNFGSGMVSFSVEVLKRCSASGVDPYTALVGQTIAKCFPLGRLGRQNVQTAVAGLKCYSGWGNVLWFGFGVKSLVRALATTDEGLSCLSLCAALSECFNEELAAEVFHELIVLHNPPSEFTPATSQCLALMHACSGAFATSKFPVLAEHLMLLEKPSFNPHDSMAGRGCPSPNDLAVALVAIGRVASGELVSIRIVGCAAAGWIGAIAEWLYDLSVTVHDDREQLLYTNCIAQQEAQVQIIFESNRMGRSAALQCVSKTCYLHDSNDIIKAEGNLPENATFVHGRVPWETCLSSTFGYDFGRMMRTPVNVGRAFGCAAKLLNILVQGEQDVDIITKRGWPFYFDSSRGQGLINSALYRFPEFEGLREHMEESLKLTVSAAKARYEEELGALRRSCGCEACTWSDFQPPEGFCLVILFNTIVLICLTLAGVIVADDLFPTRSRLHTLYNTQENSLRPCHRGSGMGLGYLNIILGTLCDVDVLPRHAITLFSGCEARSSLTSYSAISERGFCFYLDSLRELLVDKEHLGRVHIVPGKIEFHNKPYNQVRDRRLQAQAYPEPENTNLGISSISTMITETARDLVVCYELKGEAGTFYISPAEFNRIACRCRRLVTCKRQGCPVIVPGLQRSKACDKVFVNGIDLTFFDGHEAENSALVYFRQRCILRGDVCDQCCLKKALRTRKHYYIISA